MAERMTFLYIVTLDLQEQTPSRRTDWLSCGLDLSLRGDQAEPLHQIYPQQKRNYVPLRWDGKLQREYGIY